MSRMLTDLGHEVIVANPGKLRLVCANGTMRPGSCRALRLWARRVFERPSVSPSKTNACVS